jgi:hypothetical protein
MNNKYVKVTKDNSKDVEYWLPCLSCQSETVHRVVSSLDSNGEMASGTYSYQWKEEHQIIQCQGCRSFSFRHESSNSEDYFQTSEDEYEYEVIESLYPPRYSQRPQLPDVHFLPHTVVPIYKETHFTLCARQFILAGIGIRALVESVCKDKKTTGNLYEMIESLVESGDLKRGEADILQQLRFMGNSAAHEAKPHDEAVLVKTFDIVEHLLVNVYLLEIRARQLPSQ